MHPTPDFSNDRGAYVPRRANPQTRPGGKPARPGPARPGPSHRTPRPTRPGASRPGGGRRFGSRGGRPARPSRGRTRVEHAPATRPRTTQTVPPPSSDTVRIVPLGGVEEIGRNMTAVEIGDDIFILDCGFQFSEDETPGIDYILPNTGYLE